MGRGRRQTVCGYSDLTSRAGQAAITAPEGPPLGELVWEAIDRPCHSWWVLHTRARCEKAVAALLEEHSISHYLPLVESRRTYGKRVISFAKPLFPGYLFMCGGTQEYYAAFGTRRVATILRVADQERIRAELRHIYRVAESGEAVDLYPSLREGRRCRITAGCLKDVEGVVLRRRAKSRMYIAATALGQSAVIEVDSALLETID